MRDATPEAAFRETEAPGQEPYTPEQRAQLDALVADAAEAVETVGEDELERFAELERAKADAPPAAIATGSAPASDKPRWTPAEFATRRRRRKLAKASRRKNR